MSKKKKSKRSILDVLGTPRTMSKKLFDSLAPSPWDNYKWPSEKN